MSDKGMESADDFEKFIRHSDFGKVLQLADSLKNQKSKLATIARGEQGRQPAPSSISLSSRKKKKPNPTHGFTFPGDGSTMECREGYDVGGRNGIDNLNSFDSAADLIRQALIRSGDGSKVAAAMRRGECLVTDSLIDETIMALADELRYCLDLKKQLREKSRLSQVSEKVIAECQSMNNEGTKLADTGVDINLKGGGSQQVDAKSSSIATKFSKWQTDILTDWMIEHREHPFPTKDQVRALAKATKLRDTQVVNWTTNVRKRNLKATVEQSKKPHHFLDFLFLATDRERSVQLPVWSFKDEPSAPPNKAGLVGSNPSGSNPSHQSYRHVAPPRAPRNVDQIFRNGGHGLKKAALPVAHVSQQQKETEAEYTPFGFTPPPPSFSRGFGESGKVARAPHSLPERKAVSFESRMSDAPFDENAADYLTDLLSG